ncbi:MAG TPA: hypothetical protein VF958_04085 [Thermoanaerobaculia bacterium]
MSPKRRWWLLALVSLIAIAAIGSWGCCSVKCCETKPRNQLVLVPSTEMVSPDVIAISWHAHQEIVWKLESGSNIRSVDIRLEGKPKPFAACDVTKEGLCKIACGNGLCLSGPIDPALPQPREKPYPHYKYEFGKSDSTASADPEIRIDP